MRWGIRRGLPGCIFCLHQQRGQESKELLWISKYAQEGHCHQTKTFQSSTLCHSLSNYCLCGKKMQSTHQHDNAVAKNRWPTRICKQRQSSTFSRFGIEHRPETDRWVNRPVSQLLTAISEEGRQPERWYKFYLCLPCPVQLQQGI